MPDSLALQEPVTEAPSAFDVAADDDRLRAGTYRLLGALLAMPPGRPLLDSLRDIAPADDGGDGLAAAWQALRQAGMEADPAALDDEYQNLFIGIGSGEVTPYASWYLTGFLMERPLARLRQDLAALGIRQRDGVVEPEDHAAALCEAMALVIGGHGDGATERAWFDAHLAPWLGRFFRDLQAAPSARFYRAVGALGEEFIQFERQYLALPEAADEDTGGDHP